MSCKSFLGLVTGCIPSQVHAHCGETRGECGRSEPSTRMDLGIHSQHCTTDLLRKEIKQVRKGMALKKGVIVIPTC